MKYGCIEDCKSRLGKRLMQWRAERPSEWLMDEFILDAEEQHDEIARLRAEVDSLTMELATAVQNGEALRVDAEICSDLVQIVEGHFGAMHHGVWNDRAGLRLKDTKRWARFYVMAKKLDAAIDAARGKDNAD